MFHPDAVILRTLSRPDPLGQGQIRSFAPIFEWEAATRSHASIGAMETETLLHRSKAAQFRLYALAKHWGFCNLGRRSVNGRTVSVPTWLRKSKHIFTAKVFRRLAKHWGFCNLGRRSVNGRTVSVPTWLRKSKPRTSIRRGRRVSHQIGIHSPLLRSYSVEHSTGNSYHGNSQNPI